MPAAMAGNLKLENVGAVEIINRCLCRNKKYFRVVAYTGQGDAPGPFKADEAVALVIGRQKWDIS